MAKRCQITDKDFQIGGGYSNRTRATQFNPTGKRKRKCNMITRKIEDPDTKKKIKIVVSARGLRTLNKRGVKKTLKKKGII